MPYRKQENRLTKQSGWSNNRPNLTLLTKRWNILKNNDLYFYSLKPKRFGYSKVSVLDSDTLPVLP